MTVSFSYESVYSVTFDTHASSACFDKFHCAPAIMAHPGYNGCVFSIIPWDNEDISRFEPVIEEVAKKLGGIVKK